MSDGDKTGRDAAALVKEMSDAVARIREGSDRLTEVLEGIAEGIDGRDES